MPEFIYSMHNIRKALGDKVTHTVDVSLIEG